MSDFMSIVACSTDFCQSGPNREAYFASRCAYRIDRLADTSAPCRPRTNADFVISAVAPCVPYPGSRKIDCGSRWR